jgi:hypothetical protein
MMVATGPDCCDWKESRECPEVVMSDPSEDIFSKTEDASVVPTAGAWEHAPGMSGVVVQFIGLVTAEWGMYGRSFW